MSEVFDKLLATGIRSGQIPGRTQKARDWYRDLASRQGRVNEKRFVNADLDRVTQSPHPGSMYMYLYDPKTKEQLPFYDKFPLIFPFRVQGDRFWGLNVHYLPHTHRAKLMDSLYDLKTNSRYDDTTKLRMSYQVLSAASKFRFFKPCVKQYLFSHMQSKFVYVHPTEWDIALFLPLERFAKASKAQVWSDSRKRISENA